MGQWTASIWKHHLADSVGPRVHLLSDRAEEGPVRHACSELGYRIFALDVGRACSERQLIRVWQRALVAPYVVDQSWDQLLDVLRDLSWAPASGYVLTITSEPHLRLSEPAIATLIHVLETIIEFWRDDDAHRPSGVPLHVVTLGTVDLNGHMASAMIEPSCRHDGQTIVATHVPAALVRSEIYADARRMLKMSGARPIPERRKLEEVEIPVIGRLLDEEIVSSPCLICGRQGRKWPTNFVIDSNSLVRPAPLIRLENLSTAILASREFVDAVEHLELPNLRWEPVTVR